MGVFGTKMRSFIKQPDPAGVKTIASQQFDLAHRILAKGLVPILEPEVDIRSPGKAEAESLLKAALREGLADLPPGQQVMLKLSLPSQDDFYTDFVTDDRVMRVLALSGGYTREEAVERLARDHGVIASFSRALLEGLSAQQSDEEFNATLLQSVESIYEASIT
jgi:fructose-bisphosphate aldolase class I